MVTIEQLKVSSVLRWTQSDGKQFQGSVTEIGTRKTKRGKEIRYVEITMPDFIVRLSLACKPNLEALELIV